MSRTATYVGGPYDGKREWIDVGGREWIDDVRMIGPDAALCRRCVYRADPADWSRMVFDAGASRRGPTKSLDERAA